jgi:carbonic anhydrase
MAQSSLFQVDDVPVGRLPGLYRLHEDCRMFHARRHAAKLLIAAALAVPFAIANAEPHGPTDAHSHDAKHDAKPAGPVATAPANAGTAGIPADEAIKMLADGNARFVAGASARPHMGQGRLCDTFANGQHPYAAVLSCADSRVPVEHVLDAGIGDLFVVRVAGNVADVDEIGTLEYGVEHLGINSILVMGHTKCGAVTAVVDGVHVTKNIEKLVDNIVPAAELARKQFPQLSGSRLVSQAIRFNVQRAMADLVANSDVIRDRVKSGNLKIVGGVYDLHSGEIDWMNAATPSTADHVTPTVPSHGDKHAEPKHDDAGHTTVDPKAAHSNAADPKKKDNFIVLGGLLAGSGVASAAIFKFVGRGSRNQPAVETPAKPA